MKSAVTKFIYNLNHITVGEHEERFCVIKIPPDEQQFFSFFFISLFSCSCLVSGGSCESKKVQNLFTAAELSCFCCPWRWRRYVICLEIYEFSSRFRLIFCSDLNGLTEEVQSRFGMSSSRTSERRKFINWLQRLILINHVDFYHQLSAERNNKNNSLFHFFFSFVIKIPLTIKIVSVKVFNVREEAMELWLWLMLQRCK